MKKPGVSNNAPAKRTNTPCPIGSEGSSNLPALRLNKSKSCEACCLTNTVPAMAVINIIKTVGIRPIVPPTLMNKTISITGTVKNRRKSHI